MKKLLYQIFNKNSKLSSKRIQSYIVMLVMFIYIFVNPVVEIVYILCILIAGLQAVTIFQPKQPITITTDTPIISDTKEKNIGFKKNVENIG